MRALDAIGDHNGKRPESEETCVAGNGTVLSKRMYVSDHFNAAFGDRGSSSIIQSLKKCDIRRPRPMTKDSM